jgi:hypothetical protein
MRESDWSSDVCSSDLCTILACQPENEFGTTLAAGDLNGDGLDDLAAGYHFGSSGDLFQSEGQVLVFLGKKSFPQKIDLKIDFPDLIVSGASKDDELGQMVALADLNGDGIDDLVGTASGWGKKSGALFCLLGRPQLPTRVRYGSHSCDFIIEGIDVHNAIGSTLTMADVDGDGLSDLLFSTRDGERLGLGGEGRTFVCLAVPPRFRAFNDWPKTPRTPLSTEAIENYNSEISWRPATWMETGRMRSSFPRHSATMAQAGYWSSTQRPPRRLARGGRITGNGV